MNSRGLWYACAGVCGVLALGATGMAASNAAWVPSPNTSAATTPGVATTTPDTYFVEKVVDGDTIDVNIDGKTTRLRLVGMDTPEVVDPRKPVQCFGKEASAEGHKMLENQWVRLEYDAVSGTYDRYGRTLAYVFRASDGLFYNEFMIANGFAHEYTYESQHYKYQADFKAAQARAEEEQLGFWSPSTCSGNTTKPASTQTP